MSVKTRALKRWDSPPWSEERLKQVEAESLRLKNRRELELSKIPPESTLRKIRMRPQAGWGGAERAAGFRGDVDDSEDGKIKGTVSKKKPLVTIGTFRRSDNMSPGWTMRCLGTATDQRHLMHKEIVYLFRRRRAYASLRSEIWRLDLAHLTKMAARRCWGRVPPQLVVKLHDEEACTVAEFCRLWPEPLEQLGYQWDEIYLKEFPEVVDRNVWGQKEWHCFYTPFSRDFVGAPSPHIQRIMAWEPKPDYKRELPCTGNLAVDLDATLEALGAGECLTAMKAARRGRSQASNPQAQQQLASSASPRAGAEPSSCDVTPSSSQEVGSANTKTNDKKKDGELVTELQRNSAAAKTRALEAFNKASTDAPTTTCRRSRRILLAAAAAAASSPPTKRQICAEKPHHAGDKARASSKNKGEKCSGKTQEKDIDASCSTSDDEAETLSGREVFASQTVLYISPDIKGGPFSPISIPDSPTDNSLPAAESAQQVFTWDPSRPQRSL
ncbi:hypothetical protein ACSSS7_000999 [Eimeria intestinalis]